MMDALKLLKYNLWANELVASQIETLSQEVFERDFGGSFASLRLTLIHMLEADWIWMNRFNGIPLADFPAWQTHNAHVIKQVWIQIQEKMIAAAQRLASDTDHYIMFTTRKGESVSMPALEVIIHLTHHGSYHRGQLSSMIRMSGEKPVGTDYLIFSMQQNKI